MIPWRIGRCSCCRRWECFVVYVFLYGYQAGVCPICMLKEKVR